MLGGVGGVGLGVLGGHYCVRVCVRTRVFGGKHWAGKALESEAKHNLPHIQYLQRLTCTQRIHHHYSPTATTNQTLDVPPTHPQQTTAPPPPPSS